MLFFGTSKTTSRATKSHLEGLTLMPQSCPEILNDQSRPKSLEKSLNEMIILARKFKYILLLTLFVRLFVYIFRWLFTFLTAYCLHFQLCVYFLTAYCLHFQLFVYFLTAVCLLFKNKRFLGIFRIFSSDMKVVLVAK